MNLRKENDRKGAIVTTLVHVILLLLLIQWVIAKDPDMMDEESGLLVSFGEVNAGGSDAVSEVAESMPQETQPTPTVEETQDEMVTQEEDAPEVVEHSPTTPQTQPVEEEEQKIDPELERRLREMRERQNAHQNRNAGDNPNDGPGGDPNETQTGPGGHGEGIGGPGTWEGTGLSGFKVSGGTSVRNERQEFGTVKLQVCVDARGRVETVQIAGGTTTVSTYLRDLAKKAARSYSFSPKQGTEHGGCGIFTIEFTPR